MIMKLNLRITKKYSMYVPTRGLCTHRLCEFELIYVFFKLMVQWIKLWHDWKKNPNRVYITLNVV